MELLTYTELCTLLGENKKSNRKNHIKHLMKYHDIESVCAENGTTLGYYYKGKKEIPDGRNVTKKLGRTPGSVAFNEERETLLNAYLFQLFQNRYNILSSSGEVDLEELNNVQFRPCDLMSYFGYYTDIHKLYDFRKDHKEEIEIVKQCICNKKRSVFKKLTDDTDFMLTKTFVICDQKNPFVYTRMDDLGMHIDYDELLNDFINYIKHQMGKTIPEDEIEFYIYVHKKIRDYFQEYMRRLFIRQYGYDARYKNFVAARNITVSETGRFRHIVDDIKDKQNNYVTDCYDLRKRINNSVVSALEDKFVSEKVIDTCIRIF